MGGRSVLSITGNLGTMGLQEILQWISLTEKSGTLFIEADGTAKERRFLFDGGALVGIEPFPGNVVSDLSDRPEVYKRLRAAAERAVGECLFRKSGNFRFAEGSSEALRRTVSIDATRLLHLAAQRADEDAAGEERPQREVVTTATLGTDLLYVGDTPGRPDLSSIPVLALADSQPVLTEPISGARAMGLLDGGVVESPQYFSVRREPASRRDWALAGVALLTTIAVASGVLWRTNTDRQAVAAMRASADVRESPSEATGGGIQTAIVASATVGGLETLAHSLGPETSEGDLSANPSRRVTRIASTALARPAGSSVVSTVSTRDEGTDSGRSTTFASPPAASPRATRPQSLPTDALQPTFADRPSESFDGGTFLGNGNTVITPLQEVTAPVLVVCALPTPSQRVSVWWSMCGFSSARTGSQSTSNAAAKTRPQATRTQRSPPLSRPYGIPREEHPASRRRCG